MFLKKIVRDYYEIKNKAMCHGAKNNDIKKLNTNTNDYRIYFNEINEFIKKYKKQLKDFELKEIRKIKKMLILLINSTKYLTEEEFIEFDKTYNFNYEFQRLDYAFSSIRIPIEYSDTKSKDDNSYKR